MPADGVLEKLIYNCGDETTNGDTAKLIAFVRGSDEYSEDPGTIRQSLIGDSFHSDLVYVGAPVGSLSSSNDKTEAYFRNANGSVSYTHLTLPTKA